MHVLERPRLLNSAAKTVVPSDSRASLMDQAACAALTARVGGTRCATRAFRIARTADSVVQVQALILTCKKLANATISPHLDFR